MLLEHIGISRSQEFLNHLLGLTSIGTPYSNIRHLAQLGVNVTMEASDEAALRDTIDQNQPVIVFLMTGDLPYWLDNASHAVVVVGYDEESVFLNDPMFDAAPRHASWDEFLLAWSEQDYLSARLMR